MRKKLCLLLIIILCLNFVGCDKQEKETERYSKDIIIYIDDLGRNIEIPKNISKVVPSGALSQIYLLSACPEKLCALSSKIKSEEKKYYNETINSLPDIGALYGKNDLNIESLVNTSPDLIIDIGENKNNITEQLDDITKKTNIPVIHLDGSLFEIGNTFKKLSDIVGTSDRINSIINYSNEALIFFDDLSKGLNENNKKNLLYLTGNDGLSIIPSGNIHSEMIDLIANNIARDKNNTIKGTGMEIDIEQLINYNPEYIIFSNDSYYSQVLNDKKWSTLKAVKNSNFYETPYMPYSFMGMPPASNRIIGLYWLSSLLYPEKTNYDLKEKTIDFYKFFYNYNLNDDEYESLMKNSILK